MLLSLLQKKETKILLFVFLLSFCLLTLTRQSLISFGYDEMLIVLFAGIFAFPAFFIVSFAQNKKNQFKAKTVGIVHNNKAWFLFAVLFSFMFAWWLYSPTLASKWAMIDDHEIRNFLGDKDRLSISDVIPTLLKTEVGQYGTFTRFRPFYYFARLLECVIWGNNPMLWYLFRILLLFFSFLCFWVCISRVINWFPAGLLCLATFTSIYWADIFSRLGPGETYAVPGLAIFTYGFIESSKRLSDKSKKVYWFLGLVCIGSLVCMGSKENFLFLIFPLFYLLYKFGKARKPLGSFMLGACLIYSFYIAMAILLAVSKTGADIYSNSVSVQQRFGKLLIGLQVSGTLSVLFIFGVILLLMAMSMRTKKFQDIKYAIKSNMFVVIAILSTLLFQLVFYNGLWPTASRYDFPGMLFAPAVLLVVWHLVSRFIHYSDNSVVLKTVMNFALVGSLIFYLLLKGFSYQQQAIQRNVDASIAYSEKIEKIIKLLDDNPNSVLVLESSNYIDYEPVFSYARFLAAANVENKIFLSFHIDATNAGREDLQKNLVQISVEGNEYISPLAELNQFKNDCYAITLSGDRQSSCILIE